MSRDKKVVTVAFVLAVGVLVTSAHATIPYSPVSGPFPGFGPGVITPDLVGGKEYTHDLDHRVDPNGPPDVILTPEQIVAWDGTIGASGVTNVANFAGTRPRYTPLSEIDAIANHRDFGYQELKADLAHLVFSVDDAYALYTLGGPVPGVALSAGPITLGNGNIIGGAGEYSVEECFACGGGLDTQALWAAQADINGMSVPVGPDDMDGVELWGPEPYGMPLMGDVNKYSIDTDILTFGSELPRDAVSVWNASGTAYVPHSAVVAAVIGLLPGPTPSDISLEELINLDALMVREVVGDPNKFEPGEGPIGGGPGPGDEIIFSIRQIPNPGDPDGYYATGSELFVLNADGTATYLLHGGHVWDHTYALGTFNIWPGAGPGDEQNYGVLDVNAIEAIGEFAVPEPGTCVLATLGLLACGAVSFRRRG